MGFSSKTQAAQRELCQKYGAEFFPTTDDQKVGINASVRNGTLPINGLRHPPEGDASGWYIWAGDQMGSDTDFFVPLHVRHLDQWCPRVMRYLGLPPGWRFLIADDYEDVWFDETLLNME